MKVIKNLSVALGLASVLAMGGCDATVGGTGDATGDGTAGDAVVAADIPATTDTVAAADTAVAATGYLFVTIDGAPEKNPDCTTSSAGADLDVIALYRGGKLIGVGKPGTCTYKAGAAPKCAKWGKTDQCSFGTADPKCHNNVADACGGLNTVMYTDAKPDTGYVGIGSGTVELKIGACTTAGADLKGCDGAGADVPILAGDELDVYEVDGSYKAGSKTFADGIAAANCVCTAEQYEVFVSKEAGKGLVTLGTHTGSKSQIKVQ